MAADSVKTGAIHGVVTLKGGSAFIAKVTVQLTKQGENANEATFEPRMTLTDTEGRFEFQRVPADTYQVSVVFDPFGAKPSPSTVPVTADETAEVNLLLDLPSVHLSLRKAGPDGGQDHTLCHAVVGDPVLARLDVDPNQISKVMWSTPPEATSIECAEGLEMQFRRTGTFFVRVTLVGVPPSNQVSSAPQAPPAPPSSITLAMAIPATEAPERRITGDLQVSLQRPASECTPDQILWIAIRDRTWAISFERYRQFLNRVLMWEENQSLPEPIERRLRDLGANLHGTGAYQVLKVATEVFLLLECGVRIGRDHHHHKLFQSRLRPPWLTLAVTVENSPRSSASIWGVLRNSPTSDASSRQLFRSTSSVFASGHKLLIDKINEPCLIELIWSYWHEEGMLMQTMNAISRRFQNIRKHGDRDPLLNLEIDPLRPANNLLWGYVQDEPNRLTVARRASEYMHEYGLSLYGKALHHVHSADTRSKFLEAFHNLLYKAFVFFKEDAQTTVIADGYPLLNALKDVHLILAQGAHNQFGDMPWTARAEMLLVQFILARPEIRDFLQSRAMVPYKEPWMPQVDAMKTMQGWSDVTVTHFRDLAVYGEQLLLSIRYGDWTNVDNEDSAKNWARFHKEPIYAYLNANRIATGIDLSNLDTIDSTVPAVLLQRRLQQQHQRVR